MKDGHGIHYGSGPDIISKESLNEKGMMSYWWEVFYVKQDTTEE